MPPTLPPAAPFAPFALLAPERPQNFADALRDFEEKRAELRECVTDLIFVKAEARNYTAERPEQFKNDMARRAYVEVQTREQVEAEMKARDEAEAAEYWLKFLISCNLGGSLVGLSLTNSDVPRPHEVAEDDEDEQRQ